MAELTHAQAHRYLHAAADGCLSAGDRALLKAHLARCAECRAYAADLDRLQAMISHALHVRWKVRYPSGRTLEVVPSRARKATRRNHFLRFANVFAQAGSLVMIAMLFLNLLHSQGFPLAGAPTDLPASAPPSLATTHVAATSNLPAFEFESESDRQAGRPDDESLLRGGDLDPADYWLLDEHLIAR